jgi:glycosyltransferase involved in cell wall biosynthesis
VIAQSYKNYEIIIIDDNSTENIELFLNGYLQKYKFLYYKNSKNRGASSCRNKGTEIANGEFVTFLDSDDVMLEKKIELLVKEAIISDADYIYGGWQWVNFDTNNVVATRKPNKSNGLIDCLPRWCYNIVPDLVKTSVMRSQKFNPDIKSHELFDFTICMFKDYKVAYIPVIISKFRDHRGERNSSNNRGKIVAIDFLFENHLDYLEKQKAFSSKLKLSQGIYSRDNKIGNPRKNILEAIKLNPLNYRAYYHLIKTFS